MVKRFDPSRIEEYEHFVSIEESEDGDYVLYTDYAALESEADRLRERVKELEKKHKIALTEFYGLAALHSPLTVKYDQLERRCVEFERRNRALAEENEYLKLYVDYLTGGLTKEEFKEQAKKYAQLLDLDADIKQALAETGGRRKNEILLCGRIS